MTRAAVGALLAFAALAIPATTGAQHQGPSGASNCPAATGPGFSAGQIMRLVHVDVQVGASYVGAAPWSLQAGQDVCTDSYGQAVINLSHANISTSCTLRPSGDLEVYPPSALNSTAPGHRALKSGATTVALLQSGRAWCTTSTGKGAWYSAKVGHAYVQALDPEFEIESDPTGTTVGVGQGLVRVSTAKQLKTITLGPHWQVRIKKDGTIGAKTAFALHADDLTSIAELGAALPKAIYFKAPPTKSTVVTAIFVRHVIRVGYTPQATAQLKTFLGGYFNFLVSQWKLKSAVVELSSAAALKAHKIDVLVTPASTIFTPRWNVPSFLTDPHQQSWSLQTADASLADVLRNFFTTSVSFGPYGAQYESIWGTSPDYASLADRFFSPSH